MPSPSLTEQRQIATRRHIARVAARLFSEQGVQQTTVAQIAEESGVALRTFYSYFDSKQSAIAPALDDGSQMLASALSAIAPEVELGTAIRLAVAAAINESEVSRRSPEAEWIRNLLRVMETDPQLKAIWLGSLHSAENDLCVALRNRADGPDDNVELRLLAAAVVSSARIAVETWAAREPGEIDAAELALRCIALAMPHRAATRNEAERADG